MKSGVTTATEVEMRTFRTLIVDQDFFARQQLADMLKERSEIEIIGSCKNGEEAIEALNTHKPDLVFLQIELPEINGFDVVENIGGEYYPLIIFTSSYKDFAAQAFDVEALDYLQKPFDPHRVEKSLDRISKRMINGLAKPEKVTIGNLMPAHRNTKNLERFIIKQSGEYHLIRTGDIIVIEADGNYSRIMTREKKFMVRYTLTGFEEQLDSYQFYRISRSQIVNIDYVVKIKDHIYGNYIVELNNGISLKMSKNYKQLLEALKNF